ncbi:MAG TPA: serine/threonine-protein kinase [Candidatus Krumholzibacteria bacterium]|nr:serine/threonine-protein kinase [Candidatus Krumholzibacteria bacterium]
MDAARWAEVQRIFLEACERPVAEREAYAAAACGDDEALRREVLSLLEADGKADAVDAFADSWLAPLAAGAEGPSLVGADIGPYRVTGEVGRGGMARVYRAERADGQFQQQVAVKVLRRDHGELVRRFVHERRVLARLEHPHIARLIDGGALPDGSPYLVMEYVDGQTIDAWVDARRPDVRATVALVLQVCEAVQFAHRSLVVHRDLKPGNILVTAEGRVRLLDFGIAKLLEDDAPQLTRPFAQVLTPEYASPEQMRGEDITTSTDVYALGLVLYRLLTGVAAQPAAGLSDAEIRRRIVEVEPPLPSRAVADAERARALRGDLDTIVMRALAKDAQRRYGSALELADDLRRWQQGRPVKARPDGRRYRLGKFIGRHRVGVAAGAIAVLSLVAGLAGTLWQASEAARERDAAESAALRATQVSRFMVELFEAADPLVAGGDTLTARQLLDRGSERLAASLDDQPAVRAALLRTMGESYLNLGLLDRADSLLHAAYDLGQAGAFGDSLDVAAARDGLARLDEARGRPAEAAAGYGEVLAVRRRQAPGEAELLASSWNNLGSALMGLARPDSAIACFSEAVRLRDAAGSDPLDRAVTMANLAAALGRTGAVERADSLFAAADSLMRRAGAAQHPQRANLLSNWGVMTMRRGDLPAAGERMAEALMVWRHVLGDSHPQVAIAENNLASLLERQGELDDAEAHYREALRIKRLALGGEHLSTARTLNNLALLLQRRGDLAAAEALLRESAGIRERTLPADHPEAARGWYNLARLLHDTGRDAEAEGLYRKALEARAQVLGDDHAETRATAESLAALLAGLGRLDEARALEDRFGLQAPAEAGR